MTFNYHGVVELRTRNRLHVIRNKGTQALFNIFAEFLVGNTTRMTELKSIQLFRGREDELLLPTTSYVDAMVSHKIPLKSQQTQLIDDKKTLDLMGLSDKVNIYGATFYTTIKQEFLIEKTAVRGSAYSLGLFSGSTLLAVIDFDWEVYNNICNGGRADVKWTMVVSNSVLPEKSEQEKD